MSRTLVQPVGQKRLTNVAVVRLRKHGQRFEIACFPNKVLSWRTRVEKDLDEVLQSHTVYSNVSKGVLANSQDLIKAFGTDDQTKICIQILDKGELQVSGKEREAQLSSQFRDIATIVMEKTINPETRRPYTITMIERLMHEIHFAVDPNLTSKEQALKVIKKLMECFPIKRAPLRVRFTAPKPKFPGLMEKVIEWNAIVISKDESVNPPSVVCEIEPSLLHSCEERLRDVQGRVEVLSVSAHAEGGSSVDLHDNVEELQTVPAKETDGVSQISETMQKRSISTENQDGQGKQQRRCKECDVLVEDKLYREHCKSGWHKHNYTRHKNGLPPLSQEECMVEMELADSKRDLKDYDF
jgi:ribosome maturation protein SDO1